MKSFLLTSLSAALACSPLNSPAADLPDAYREITLHVHNPVGSDSGIEVFLKGLGRGPMTSGLDLYAESTRPNSKARGWKFKTDAKGNCTVRFGKFDFWDHLKTTGIAEPGYGAYFLIVEPQDHAGGVSSPILNLNDEDQKSFTEPKLDASIPIPGEEWCYLPRVLTDELKDAEPLKIALERGIDVSGRLVDPKGRPIRGEQVALWNDLGADTHTGRGGEIFEQSVETDRLGRFRFHRVYPNLFYLSLQAQQDDRLCWTRTRVRQRWVDGAANAIWPHVGEVDLPLAIVASRDLPYHYFGKVTDEKGHPISAATVRIQASIHGPGGRIDFEDGHGHHSQAVTRKDGRYDVGAAGPYVNSFEITAPGSPGWMYSEDGEIYGLGLYEEVPCAPGRYDFVLKRK
jgi:hypothetical protein